MSKKDIGHKVLDIIKDKKIEPKPRWEFLLLDYVIWGFGFVAIFVGGLAVAVIIFMVSHNDLDLLVFTGRSRISGVFFSLPYYWLLFLSLFVIVAYYNFKHTKKGYRHGLVMVILVSVGASIILGILFHGIGMGQAIDNSFAKKLPFYKMNIHRNPRMWMKIDKGVIAGDIIEKVSDKEFSLIDLKGNDWQVRCEDLCLEFACDNLFKTKVIVAGKALDNNEFEASVVRPWMRGAMIQMKSGCMSR
ncbi:MAG: hypothetical protein ABIE43_05215 [Patescibacteria group bacterium]